MVFIISCSLLIRACTVRDGTFLFAVFPFQDQPGCIQHFNEVQIRTYHIALRYIVERSERKIHDFRNELLELLKRIFLKGFSENPCRIAVFFFRQRAMQQRIAWFRKEMNQPFSALLSKTPPCPNKRSQRLVEIKDNGRIFRNPGFAMCGVLHDTVDLFFGGDQIMKLEKDFYQRECGMLVPAGPEAGFEVDGFFHARSFVFFSLAL